MWGAALGATKRAAGPRGLGARRASAGGHRGAWHGCLAGGVCLVGVSYVDGGMWLPHRRRRWFSTPGPQEGTDGSPGRGLWRRLCACVGRVPAAQMDDPDVLHKALDAVLSDEGAGIWCRCMLAMMAGMITVCRAG